MGCCCGGGLLPYHMTAAGRKAKRREKQVVPGDESDDPDERPRSWVRPTVNPMINLRLPSFLKRMDEEEKRTAEDESEVAPEEMARMRRENALAQARAAPRSGKAKQKSPKPADMTECMDQMIRSCEMYYRESCKMPKPADREKLRNKEAEVLAVAEKLLKLSRESKLGGSEAQWKKTGARLATANAELKARKEITVTDRTPKPVFQQVLDGMNNALALLIEEASKVKDVNIQTVLFDLQGTLLNLVSDITTICKLWKLTPEQVIDRQMARLTKASKDMKAYGLAPDIPDDVSDDSGVPTAKIKGLSKADRSEIDKLRELRRDARRTGREVDAGSKGSYF